VDKLCLLMAVLCLMAVGCSDDSADGGDCTAPLQAQADGTCACPAGTQLVAGACQAETMCPSGMMADPANPGMCVPVMMGTDCGAGMMADPANPGTCIPMGTMCPDGMMEDPANPGMCIPTGGGAPAASCAEADTSGDTYEAMQVMLTSRCGVCHRESQAPSSAGLQLTGPMSMDRAEDLLSLVVRSACEIDMPVVDQSGGDAGLANSWLYWKVAGPAGTGAMIEARPEWMAGSESCVGLDTPGTFGLLMPLGATEPVESVLTAVRNWICAGAPGPADGGGAAGMGGGT